MASYAIVDANGIRTNIGTVGTSLGTASQVSVVDGSGTPIFADPTNNLSVEIGGRSSALNLTAAAVIKNTLGRLRRIIIIAPGTTSGAFTFNDCATLGAAAAANEIFTLPYNATANVAGAVIPLDWPCATGIVLSAVPGAGAPVIAVAYD